jgi:hypothetical protein
MNTGIERRPFKVLKPLKHSTAMVIARYANREAGVIAPAHVEPGDIVWRALRVGGVCAACAFAFFVLSERHLFERSGETAGSVPGASQRLQFTAPRAVAPTGDSKTVSMPTAPQMLAPPADKRLKITEFALEVSPEFQDLDGVELRLTGVNAAAHTYDITVRTREREFYRQDVGLAEHVPLLKKALHGPELVVGEIGRDRVSGYLSEPLHRGHRRHHRRNKE